MHIAIDARAYHWTGIGRYIRNILTWLDKLDSPHTFTILIPNNDSDVIREQIPNTSRRFTFYEVEPSVYSWKEQIYFYNDLRKIDADIFHFTHFNIPLLFSRPYVVTIHDVTRFIFPGQKRQDLLQQTAYETVFAHAVKNARAVISVSESTKHDMQTLPLTLPEHVPVIEEGIGEQFFTATTQLQHQKIRAILETTDPYLLYVGVWMSHKNLRRLLEAFARVKQHHPRLKLVLTGKPVPGYMNMLDIVERMNLTENVVFPGFVPHDLLPALYAQAECFVFPSLYEGFGLPPLEAAACGTPVVCSNVSSLPDIMGGAAEYVNPEYVDDISRGINNVLTSKTHRTNLTELGKKRAAQFRWQDAARQHLAVYEQAQPTPKH